MSHCERSKSGSVGEWRTPFIACLAVLAATCIAQTPAHAIPDGAVRLPEDGHLYAEHSEDFTDASRGLTIEVWAQLPEIPGDDVIWPLVAQRGSYAIVLCGDNKFLPLGGMGGEVGPGTGTVYLAMGSQTLQDGVAEPKYLSPAVEEWRADTWVHVAYQILSGEGFIRDREYVNERRGGESSTNSRALGGLGTPLFVGGLSPEAEAALPSPAACWCVDRNADFQGIGGWIDEVRLSKGWRYGKRPVGPNIPWPPDFGDSAIHPVRGEGPDRDTIALWTFDAGPGQGMYPDVSGNGHTLFAGHLLAVDPKGRLAATWGQLKSR